MSLELCMNEGRLFIHIVAYASVGTVLSRVLANRDVGMRGGKLKPAAETVLKDRRRSRADMLPMVSCRLVFDMCRLVVVG